MTSLALKSHALASPWERVDDNSLAYAVSDVATTTAFGLDLSGVEAALNANQTSCSSIFASQQHEDASYIMSKGMDGEAGMPDLLAGWESMMPVDLSGSDSPQAPNTHGIATISNQSGQSMTVAEPDACADSMLAQDCIVTADATDAGAKVPAAVPAAGAAGTDNSIAGPQHLDSRDLQPTAQLSRVASLSEAVPEAPISPGSPAISSSSNSTCADNLAAAAAAAAASQLVGAVTPGKALAADVTAVAVTNSAAVTAAALGNAVTAAVPAAGHTSLPSSPRAAMAAAAAAATAAMQRRLLEQQKLSGIVIAPGLLVAASVTHLTKQSQQQVVAPTTAQLATAPASAGADQVSSSAAAAGAPGGNKRTFSMMSHSWAAAATPKQLRAFKAQEAQAAAAVAAASGGEPFTRTRSEALARYREKRARRSHVKKIRYQLRKINADKRPRIKGRFVSKEEMEKLGLLVPDYVDNVDSKSFSASDNIKPGFEHPTMVAAAAVAEAAAAHSNFCWEQQMQQMQYMGALDMLLKYDDAGQDMQLPATSAAAADSARDSSSAGSLPAVLEYVPTTGLASEADDLAGMPMEIAGAGSLELHFGEDYLNDVPDDLSHDHHHILML